MDDRQRFGEVVLPHLDDALSLARWLTGSITDAEDAAPTYARLQAAGRGVVYHFH